MDPFPIKFNTYGWFGIAVAIATNLAFWFATAAVVSYGVKIGWNL